MIDINNYPTKHKEGFTPQEMVNLCKELKLDYNTFVEKLGINTGMLKGGDMLTFHCDVELAIRLIRENRDARPYEWD